MSQDFTIARVEVFAVASKGDGGDYFQQAQGHWVIDSLISNPMSGYPEYKQKRSSWGIGVMGSILVEITTKSGATGVATGFGGAPAETETFREDGAKAARVRYEAGRLIAGTWYERDGAIGRSELTQGNERIQRTHHPSGAVRREQVSDLTRRERSAEREFSDSGTKLSEVLWQEGVRASEASWYQNGQPRERIVWSRDGNRRVAQVELFNDAGVRTFGGSRDERARPMGVHRQYDARGTLRLEQTFDDGGRPIRRREFDENGRLSADDEVFADGSRKAFAR